MVFVTDVPIFAPITTGIAVRTDIESLPTNDTTIDVEDDEDCNKTVDTIPVIRPNIGLSSDVNNSPVLHPPNTLKEFPINSRKNRKEYNKETRQLEFIRVMVHALASLFFISLMHVL
jgi:hypothetical protein